MTFEEIKVRKEIVEALKEEGIVAQMHKHVWIQNGDYGLILLYYAPGDNCKVRSYMLLTISCPDKIYPRTPNGIDNM